MPLPPFAMLQREFNNQRKSGRWLLRFPERAVGQYELDATPSGFRPYKRTSITMTEYQASTGCSSRNRHGD